MQIFGATETKRGAERERKTRKTGNRGTFTVQSQYFIEYKFLMHMLLFSFAWSYNHAFVSIRNKADL